MLLSEEKLIFTSYRSHFCSPCCTVQFNISKVDLKFLVRGLKQVVVISLDKYMIISDVIDFLMYLLSILEPRK